MLMRRTALEGGACACQKLLHCHEANTLRKGCPEIANWPTWINKLGPHFGVLIQLRSYKRAHFGGRNVTPVLGPLAKPWSIFHPRQLADPGRPLLLLGLQVAAFC